MGPKGMIILTIIAMTAIVALFQYHDLSIPTLKIQSVNQPPLLVTPEIVTIKKLLPKLPSNIFVSLGSNANVAVMDALPLAVMAWLTLDIKSLICLIGSEDVYKRDQKLDLVLRYLRELNATITFIPEPFEFKEETLAQACRLFPAKSNLSFDPDDVIITADVDYLPFHKEMHWADDVDIFTYNTLCCEFGMAKGIRFQQYPITTIGMRVKTWRDVLGRSMARYENASSIERDLSQTLDSTVFNENYFNASHTIPLNWMAAWYADQTYISYRIFAWHKGKYGQVKMGSWAKVLVRIDRWKWPAKEKLEKINLKIINDAHLIRPLMPKWRDVRPLFVKVLTLELMQMADEYANAFLKL